MGKGSKERLVPFGQVARDWIVRYLAEARAAILAGQQTEDLFVTARGQGMTREQFEAEQDDLRREIVDNVGWMKPRIISELLRIQG